MPKLFSCQQCKLKTAGDHGLCWKHWQAYLHRDVKNHPNWRGGRREDGFGYTMVYTGENKRKAGKYTAEHILVAEKALGRKLKYPQEVVHHINGVKNDNRPENLMILTNGYHKWLHSRMAEEFQKEHFR